MFIETRSNKDESDIFSMTRESDPSLPRIRAQKK